MRPLDPRVTLQLRPAAPALAGAVAAGVLGSLLVVAQMFAVAHVVVVLVERHPSSLVPAVALVVAATLLRALAGWVGDLCFAQASARVTVSLRARLLRAALALPAAELSRARSGELSLLLTRGVAASDPYLTRYLPALVLAVVLPPLTLLAIASQDLLSAAIVVVTLPLVPVFGILVGLTTRDRATRQWRTLEALAGHFVDVMRGLPTLVVHRRARAQSANIRRVTDAHRRASLGTLRVAFASSAVLELVSTLSVALVAVSVGLRLSGGTLDLFPALVVLLLAPWAYWPLRRVGAEFHAAAEGTATFAAAQELFDRVPDAGDDGQVRVPLERSGVQVRDLEVTYPGRRTPALRTGSFDLPPRGLVAVTGPSGSGKSTLLAALAGEVTAGSAGIHAGALPLEPLTTDAWRRSVAWVGQRPWLAGGSIRDTLLVGRPRATDDELWVALAEVGLDDLVAGLTAGLDAPVGEDGSRLSGGQRSRLALARAVLAARPLVLVDEPTAHLDPESERLVLEALRRLARRSTVVVVTHAPAVVAEADAVVSLVAPPVPPLVPAASPAEEPVAPAVPSDAPVVASSVWSSVATMGLGILAAGCGLALTTTSGWLITRAAEHPPVLFLMVAIVAVRTFGIGRPVFRYAEQVVGHDDALRVLAEERARVYDDLVPLVPGALGRSRGEVLASVVDDVDAVLDARLRVRQPLVTALGVGVIAIGVTLLLDPVAAAPTVVLLVLAAVAVLGVRTRTRRLERDLVEQRGELSSRVVRTVQGARDLVLWQATAAAGAEVSAAGDRLARAARRSGAAMATGRAVLLLGTGVALAATALLLRPGVAEGTISAPAAVAVLLTPLALLDVLSPLPEAAATWARTRAARARLAALAHRTPAVTEPLWPVPAPVGVHDLGAAGVGGGWDTPVLDDVDLQVARGQRVGVVGPSGSGKTTLAALLVRFLDPTTGSVRVGDADARDLALDDVRRLVGLVDDDPHVFSSSVLENVRLARPAAGRDEVETALRRVSLGAWLDGLPGGLDALVGDGHDAVSGGERARIGLARAVLADAPVLVLDEPTAHLDRATASEVATDVLEATRGRAVVWITHDGVGLEEMDRVLDLGAG